MYWNVKATLTIWNLGVFALTYIFIYITRLKLKHLILENLKDFPIIFVGLVTLLAIGVLYAIFLIWNKYYDEKLTLVNKYEFLITRLSIGFIGFCLACILGFLWSIYIIQDICITLIIFNLACYRDILFPKMDLSNMLNPAPGSPVPGPTGGGGPSGGPGPSGGCGPPLIPDPAESRKRTLDSDNESTNPEPAAKKTATSTNINTGQPPSRSTVPLAPRDNVGEPSSPANNYVVSRQPIDPRLVPAQSTDSSEDTCTKFTSALYLSFDSQRMSWFDFWKNSRQLNFAKFTAPARNQPFADTWSRGFIQEAGIRLANKNCNMIYTFSDVGILHNSPSYLFLQELARNPNVKFRTDFKNAITSGANIEKRVFCGVKTQGDFVLAARTARDNNG